MDRLENLARRDLEDAVNSLFAASLLVGAFDEEGEFWPRIDAMRDELLEMIERFKSL